MSDHPSNLEPRAIYQLENNGAANIVMHIDRQRHQKQPIDTTYIRQQARLFDSYVAKLEEGQQLSWHQHLNQEFKKSVAKKS